MDTTDSCRNPVPALKADRDYFHTLYRSDLVVRFVYLLLYIHMMPKSLLTHLLWNQNFQYTRWIKGVDTECADFNQ